MSSDRDIYQILESLDAAQRSVKQLPALFKPPQTSPQLDGPYPGRNATRGYMVGEGANEDVESLIDRYINLDYQSREGYGEEGEDPVEYFERINDEMDVIEEKIRAQFGDDAARRLLKHAYEVNYDGIDPDQATKVIENKRYDHENPMARAVHISIINQHPEWIVKYGTEELMQAIEDVVDEGPVLASEIQDMIRMIGDILRDRKGSREEMNRRRPFAEDDDQEAELNRDGEPDHGLFGDDEDEEDEQDISEGKEAATEDILSAVKARLGDYIQDVATAIKKDPDLLDKLPDSVDQIRAVKTIKTDDGHEIKILGNEDDGFRISIKNNKSNSKFSNLDEAVMAVEMFCARRRSAAESADYIEEKQ